MSSLLDQREPRRRRPLEEIERLAARSYERVRDKLTRKQKAELQDLVFSAGQAS